MWSPKKWRDTPRAQETAPVLASISRLSATSRHQPLANSMLTLLWARGRSRWLPQVPFHKISLPYGYKEPTWHCKNAQRGVKTPAGGCSAAICCLLTGKWEMAQDHQAGSLPNELVGRCILQPHGKELAAPPVLPVDRTAPTLEKAWGELLPIPPDARDEELKLVEEQRGK